MIRSMVLSLSPCSCQIVHGTPCEDVVGTIKGFHILFYRRDVDDAFCLFRSEHDANLFFNFINNRHHSIYFMMEKEINHVLLFLDVLPTFPCHHQDLHECANQFFEFYTSLLQARAGQNSH